MTNQTAVAEFNRRVQAKTAAGQDRKAAVAAVARENPDLHTAYLAATNGPGETQKLIQDRHRLNRAG